MPQEADHDILAILGRHRPAGAPARLRERVLAAAGPASVSRRRWRSGWVAAAGILLAVGLHWQTSREIGRAARCLTEGPVSWIGEAREIAHELDTEPAYLRMALASGRFIPRSATMSLPPGVPEIHP